MGRRGEEKGSWGGWKVEGDGRRGGERGGRDGGYGMRGEMEWGRKEERYKKVGGSERKRGKAERKRKGVEGMYRARGRIRRGCDSGGGGREEV